VGSIGDVAANAERDIFRPARAISRGCRLRMNYSCAGPQWLVVKLDVERPQLLRATDLARFCESHAESESEIDLLSIPGDRYELKPMHLRATLFEAREIMLKEGVEVLFVRRPLAPMTFRTFGIVHRTDVDAGYALST
jgi:hypothetical protein